MGLLRAKKLENECMSEFYQEFKTIAPNYSCIADSMILLIGEINKELNKENYYAFSSHEDLVIVKDKTISPDPSIRIHCSDCDSNEYELYTFDSKAQNGWMKQIENLKLEAAGLVIHQYLKKV